MKLLWSTQKNVDQDKDGEDVPKLESVEVVLIHCNLVNNNYQQASKVLFTFVPNKQFGQLINIAKHSLIMLSTLGNLSIYYTWKNIKSAYNINKFKTSAPTWNDTFGLPDGSYSIADIEDYFEFIIKKHETLTENPPLQIYPNKIKNRIGFKIKTGYELELLSSETMKPLGSTQKKC